VRAGKLDDRHAEPRGDRFARARRVVRPARGADAEQDRDAARLECRVVRLERQERLDPREELEKSIRAVSGVDVSVTAVRSATRFTDNARQATTYRRGRVLLAGDAAHVHSPFGGQGLNLGIGDAVNLGWKLAAVVRGRLSADVLDTYTAERHPIGAWVLDWTRAQIALMRPDPHARALREIVADLIDTTTGTTYFVKKISGVWQRYDLPGEHPWIGRSAPDLAFADGTRLADHLHGGTGLLLDLGSLPSTVDEKRVPVLGAGCADHPDLPGLLIRPDGIVAWAGDDRDDRGTDGDSGDSGDSGDDDGHGSAHGRGRGHGSRDRDGLDEAITTWFGAA
jgi:hypothetical protein